MGWGCDWGHLRVEFRCDLGVVRCVGWGFRSSVCVVWGWVWGTPLHHLWRVCACVGGVACVEPGGNFEANTLSPTRCTVAVS